MSPVQGSLAPAQTRAVIFDIDGVLIDARASYHAAAEEAARRALAPLEGAAARSVPFDRVAEVPRFKAAGHFNDDWEMSRGIGLLLLLRCRGKAPPLEAFLAAAGGRGVAGLFAAFAPGLGPAEYRALAAEPLARICGALYGGRLHCQELFGFDAADALPDAPERGLWESEEPLVPATLLAAIQRAYPVALFTGRNPGEAALALRNVGLQVEPHLRWVADGRPRKPDPTGLLWLCRELLPSTRSGHALFLGDTADDQVAAQAAQAAGAPLAYAHIDSPGGAAAVLSQLLATPAGGFP